MQPAAASRFSECGQRSRRLRRLATGEAAFCHGEAGRGLSRSPRAHEEEFLPVLRDCERWPWCLAEEGGQSVDVLRRPPPGKLLPNQRTASSPNAKGSLKQPHRNCSDNISCAPTVLAS